MKTLLTLLIATFIFAQDNSLSIQGVLRQPSGKAVADGTYSLTFSFYTVDVGGSPIASGVKVQDVEIKDGLYNANVDISGIPFNAQYYIGIKVGTDPELSPRAKLTAAPYALSLRGLDNVFPSTGTVSVGNDLTVGGNLTTTGNATAAFTYTNGLQVQNSGSIYMPTKGVVQRGGAYGQVTGTDLGLYSLQLNSHIRFVSNSGEFNWFSDGGTTPNGGTSILRLATNGDLTLTNGWLYGKQAHFTEHTSAASVNITGEANFNRFRTHAVNGTISGIIAGSVNGDNSKSNGIGFTTENISSGHAKIHMTGINNSNYSVTATLNGGNDHRTISVEDRNSTSFIVKRWLGTNGDAQPFSFIVILF